MLFDLEQIVDELKIKLKEFDNTKEDRDLEKIKSEAKMKKWNQEKAQAYNKRQHDKTARKPSDYKRGDYVLKSIKIDQIFVKGRRRFWGIP